MSEPLNPVRPGTEAELTRQLADTIGQEVFDAMSGVGWNDHDPQRPAPADNPPAPTSTQEPVQPAKTDNPSTVAAPAQTPATPPVASTGIDFESLRDAQGMILGKYKTEAEAVKGVSHAVRMAKDALAEKAAVDAENARLRQELATRTAAVQTVAPGTQQVPTSRVAPLEANPKLAVVLAKLKEGEPLDENGLRALVDGVTDHAAQAAQEAARNELATHAQRADASAKAWSDVDDYMRREYPDSMRFTDEIGLFTQTNPVVGKITAALIRDGNLKEAAVYAWKEYAAAQGAQIATQQVQSDAKKEVVLEAADQVRREAVEQARKDAGVLTTSAAGVHETDNPGPQQDEIDAAARAMKSYGDAPGSPAGQRWRELTIGRTLTGPWFD